MDIDQLVQVALAAGATAVHPGYGFLSEVPDFPRALAKAGIKWIGPAPEALDLFGDKLRARSWAVERKVSVVDGVGKGVGGASADEIARFFETAKAKYYPAKGEATFTGVMIKALFGGGGRGMRALPFATATAADVRQAFDRCVSEATKAFGGRGEVYAELLIGKARHIEVQILGDGKGGLVHVWERECSVQRRFVSKEQALDFVRVSNSNVVFFLVYFRNQKILELAPSPSLDPKLRQAILQASLQLLQPLNYAGLATVEFLVPFSASGDSPTFFFMECNPRLQVEHTVTEEVTGLDLVAMQIRVCALGESIADVFRDYGGKVPEPRGFAVQLRVNMERVVPPTNPNEAPMWLPTATPPLISFDTPSSPHLRIDHCGYAGMPTNPNFDSLLAKLIARGRTLEETLRRAEGGVRDFRIEGVETTLAFLGGLTRHPLVKSNNAWTGWLDSQGWKEVLELAQQGGRGRYWTAADLAAGMGALGVDGAKASTPNEAGIKSLGTQMGDLNLVLKALEAQKLPGTEPVRVPMQSTVVTMDVVEGDKVLKGQQGEKGARETLGNRSLTNGKNDSGRRGSDEDGARRHCTGIWCCSKGSRQKGHDRPRRRPDPFL